MKKMKILTRKKQDEILKILTANRIIMCKTYIEPISYGCLIENIVDAAYLVGGMAGVEKVQASFEKYIGKHCTTD